MERGQVTIEFIIIFGFFILILVGASMTTALKSARASTDLDAVLEARENLNRIVSAVETVNALGPGAAQSITITSSLRSWEVNTNPPNDGTNPASKRPVLSYEIGAWDSEEKVPSQLYRIHSGWGALVVLDIPGIGNGPAGEERACTFDGNGKGTFNLRVENNVTNSTPRIFFPVCTQGEVTIKLV